MLSFFAVADQAAPWSLGQRKVPGPDGEAEIRLFRQRRKA